MAAIIEAGDELKVKVPIKNIGVGTGIFRLSGQIYYPNGTPTGTLKEISTGNPMAVHEILPGAM